jgi:RimJ/RimL family protein N-acetyltransferase
VAALRLEPFAASHLAALPAMLADPDTLRFTRVPVPVPAGFEQTWLERYEEGRRAGTREGFAIVDPADESVVGLALAARIDREAQTVELGYVVSPTARGRGVATEALRLLSDWAFRELDALRLELLISDDNVASQRVAARCGYVREGLLRSVYTKPGIREDTQIWSRLPTDPDPAEGWRLPA